MFKEKKIKRCFFQSKYRFLKTVLTHLLPCHISLLTNVIPKLFYFRTTYIVFSENLKWNSKIEKLIRVLLCTLEKKSQFISSVNRARTFLVMENIDFYFLLMAYSFIVHGVELF